MSGSRWQPARRLFGNRVQAGVPLKPQASDYQRAYGLLLRGVVTATYELDNPDHPEVDASAGEEPVAIYCDVLVYSSLWQQRFQFLRAVLVSQELGGIHRGRVWKPRATTLDITGSNIDLNRSTNPAHLDGDHVLVGFMDDNLNQPVIVRGIPHPNADTGNEGAEAGQRIRLKTVDGDPDFWKHHGGFFGLSDEGDFVVDLTQAYAGQALNADGTERDPPGDGTAGNYRVKLQPGAKLTVEIDGGANLELDLKDGDAKLTLGDGAKSVIIAEALQSFWDTTIKPLFDAFDAHTHTTGVGPSGGPLPVVALPSFDAGTFSTKVKIPDG